MTTPVIITSSLYLEAYRTIRSLAASDDHVIPGHDPAVLTRYAPGGREAADIVRLDLPPKQL
jgi:glyoxylase-like metal-dependent hydrolase (beta-lactamase superfamily II)